MQLLGRADTRIGLWMVALLVTSAAVWSWPPAGDDGTFGQVAAAEADEGGAEAAPENDAADEAQDADDSSQSASGELKADDQPLGKLILSSGVFGLLFYSVLAIFSIAGMAVVLERLFRLIRGKIVPPALVIGLKNLAHEGQFNLQSLRTLCDASPSPAARVLQAGLMRAGRPLAEVEKAMEDAAARELADLRSRNKPLDVIGTVAPLVGLLGTVVGMIFAFKISSQEGLGKAELLAKGIYLALMTTAGGLTIAIPCLLFHAWFNVRADKLMREIDEALLEIMPFFTRLENHQTGGETAEAISTREDPSEVQQSEPVAAG
jgi:biopolymer transport protein ExbB